jgi:hypothetical protein
MKWETSELGKNHHVVQSWCDRNYNHEKTWSGLQHPKWDWHTERSKETRRKAIRNGISIRDTKLYDCFYSGIKNFEHFATIAHVSSVDQECWSRVRRRCCHMLQWGRSQHGLKVLTHISCFSPLPYAGRNRGKIELSCFENYELTLRYVQETQTVLFDCICILAHTL